MIYCYLTIEIDTVIIYERPESPRFILCHIGPYFINRRTKNQSVQFSIATQFSIGFVIMDSRSEGHTQLQSTILHSIGSVRLVCNFFVRLWMLSDLLIGGSIRVPGRCIPPNFYFIFMLFSKIVWPNNRLARITFWGVLRPAVPSLENPGSDITSYIWDVKSITSKRSHLPAPPIEIFGSTTCVVTFLCCWPKFWRWYSWKMFTFCDNPASITDRMTGGGGGGLQPAGVGVCFKGVCIHGGLHPTGMLPCYLDL